MDVVTGYPTEGLWLILLLNCVFFLGGLRPVFKRNFTKFSIDFSKLEYFESLLSYRFKYQFFKQVLIPMYALRVLERCFGKSRPTQGHATVVTCSTSGSRHDNFIGIEAYNF